MRDVVQALVPRTTGALRILLDHPGPRVEPPLRIEVEQGTHEADATLAAEVEQLLKSRLSVPASVRLVPPGSLGRSEMKTRLVHVADGG
ncbi:hypothetical protein ACFQ1B_00465 [Streptomyces mexicanus]